MPKKVNKNKIKKKIKKKTVKLKVKLRVKSKSELKSKVKSKVKSRIKYKAALKTARRKKNNFFLTFGNIKPDRGRILVLAISIIFVITGMVFYNIINSLKPAQPIVTPVSVKKNTALTAEITKLVQGYPIEKMTPYIAEKNPKTAAFLIAIAKKESNWGERKPVLDGQDCYNYWGFRLQTDRMGSGGHTCFNSPKEAVDIVAARVDEMINEENMNSPKDMIVWKCGYGCQDETKTPSEQKWISDVNFYYDKLSGYL